MKFPRAHVFLLLIFFAFKAVPAWAQMPTWMKVSPRIATTAPVYLIGGAGLTFFDQVELSLGLGATPSVYSDAIGRAAAGASGHSTDAQFIQQAFQGNSLFRLGARYFFSSPREGWTFGGGTSRVQARGQADIDGWLAPSTGRDFSLLKNVLGLMGHGSSIDMSTTLDIYDVSVGYRWEMITNLAVDFEIGYARVYKSEIRLNTGSSNFENSQYGQSQLRGTESDLNNIVTSNGASPTLGLAFSYVY